MAEVYKRKGSPFYVCDFTIEGQPRFRKSTGTANYKEAKRIAQEWELAAEKKAAGEEGDELTLAKALAFYERKHRNNPKSDASIRIRKITGQFEGIMAGTVVAKKLVGMTLVTGMKRRAELIANSEKPFEFAPNGEDIQGRILLAFAEDVTAIVDNVTENLEMIRFGLIIGGLQAAFDGDGSAGPAEAHVQAAA